METLMSGLTVIEMTMLSFLLALWVAWMSLRGLFRMMPGRSLEAVPMRRAEPSVPRVVANRTA